MTYVEGFAFQTGNAVVLTDSCVLLYEKGEKGRVIDVFPVTQQVKVEFDSDKMTAVVPARCVAKRAISVR